MSGGDDHSKYLEWDLKRYSAKKNPFIEGLQNYRDFLQYRFRLFSSRNALPIAFLVVACPGVFTWTFYTHRVGLHHTPPLAMAFRSTLSCDWRAAEDAREALTLLHAHLSPWLCVCVPCCAVWV